MTMNSNWKARGTHVIWLDFNFVYSRSYTEQLGTEIKRVRERLVWWAVSTKFDRNIFSNFRSETFRQTDEFCENNVSAYISGAWK